MLKYFTATAVAMLFCNFALFALNPTEKRLAYEHFYNVNQEWQHHPAAVPNEILSFASDIERIAAHLKYVEQHLRKNSPKGLSKDAMQRRLALLDTLQNYAKAGVFPQNIHHNKRQPYFIDHRNVHCAVGYLIAASGRSDLARRIQQEQNYDYIRDIKTDGLMEWAEKQGFLATELAWIQPGYMPINEFVPLLNGTNGPILSLCEQGNKLYFIGNFSSADNQPCDNIGYYEDGQMHCLGGGLQGDLKNLASNYYQVMVAGRIEDGANIYPAAYFDTAWNYIDIPGRSGAEGTTIGSGYWSSHKLEVTISHAAIPNNGQEIWYLLNNNTWEKQATVYGTVYDIEMSYDFSSFDYFQFYAGAFDSLHIHRSGLPDSLVLAKNLAAKRYSQNSWGSFGNEICDTVYVIKTEGNAVYFGGKASGTGAAVARLANGQLSSLLPASAFLDSMATVYSLSFLDGKLIISGKLNSAALVGLFGNNCMRYDMANNTVEPLGLFNQAVEAVLVWQGDLYLGGSFDTCAFSSFVPHLAKMQSPGSATIVQPEAGELLAYPNPSSGTLSIDFGSVKKEVLATITDLSGRTVANKVFSQQQLLSFDLDVPAGLYFISLVSEGAVRTVKVVRE